MMNPYAAPSASAETEDRTDPAFQVISQQTPRVRMINMVLLFGGGAFLLVWNQKGPVGIGDLFKTSVWAPALMMVSALGALWASSWRERSMRRHSIVLSGEALAGGWANPRSWSMSKRGHLFLTRQALLLQLAGGERRIPLKEIERVRVARSWGMDREAIELLTADGRTERIGVFRPEAWVQAIEAARPVELRPIR